MITNKLMQNDENTANTSGSYSSAHRVCDKSADKVAFAATVINHHYLLFTFITEYAKHAFLN